MDASEEDSGRWLDIWLLLLTFPVGGGLLVLSSLSGPPVITHTNGYYGSWPGRVVSVSMFPVTFYSKTSLMEI